MSVKHLDEWKTALHETLKTALPETLIWVKNCTPRNTYMSEKLHSQKQLYEWKTPFPKNFLIPASAPRLV